MAVDTIEVENRPIYPLSMTLYYNMRNEDNPSLFRVYMPHTLDIEKKVHNDLPSSGCMIKEKREEVQQ